MCIKPSSKNINVFLFSPCAETKVIKANHNGEKFTFKEEVTDKDFEWFGELKQTVTQEIVNSVSASIARVGLDSFEWLRLKASQ